MDSDSIGLTVEGRNEVKVKNKWEHRRVIPVSSGEINWEIKTVLTSLLHWNFILWLPEDLCGIVGILNMNIRSWCVCEKESINLISNMAKKTENIIKTKFVDKNWAEETKSSSNFLLQSPIVMMRMEREIPIHPIIICRILSVGIGLGQGLSQFTFGN